MKRLALLLALISFPAWGYTNLGGGFVVNGNSPPAFSSDGVLSVKAAPYLAKGDTIGVSACTIAAAGTTLTCSAAAFTTADVGKNYYLQGSGAANIPQFGTISAFISTTSVTLSQAATVATPQSGIYSPPAAPVTLLAAGTGYTPGTQTLTITTGACTTQPQVSVTVSGGGAVTAVLSMVTPGVCTVVPASGSATTGGGGSGATFTTVGYQAAGRFLYGSDDTAAITAAVAAAAGKKLVFPPGGYWLASATTAIALNSIAIEGAGKVGANLPFVNAGSWLVISNKTSATFSGMSGVSWDGLNVYWPEQDNSTVTPTTYPALFESSQFLNESIRNSRFVNVYTLANVTTAGGSSGFGRVFLDNVSAYCVNTCFNFLNGMADVFALGPRNYFGVGAADSYPIVGPANLGRYTATSGAFIRVDLSGAAYTSIDGLELTGFIVQGMRYGIRVTNGRINVSNISNMNFDAIGSVISVEGASAILISTAITGGEIYSTNIYDATTAAVVFNFATASSTSAFTLSGAKVSFALGSVVAITGTGITTVHVAGNEFANFGRSSSAGTYVGVNIGANTTGLVTITGNTFACNRATGTVYGVNMTGAAGMSAAVSGNTFKQCSFPINIAGAGGTTNVSGNASSATVGNTSMSDLSASAALLTQGVNSWDKIPTTRAPTVTSCGSGAPVVATTSSWQRGSVVIPTVATGCTVTFPATLPYAPFCTINISSSAITAAVTSTSTTTLVAAFSADMAGATMYWNCGP